MELTSKKCITSFEKLPRELLYHIARYLSAEELDTCYDTCARLRYLLNVDSLWKKCCLYPEKYFLSLEKYGNNVISKIALASETCIWRQRFENQKKLLHNWSIGNYTVSDTGISTDQSSLLRDFVDDDGNHWLLDGGHSGITIWNITSNPIFISCLKERNNFGSHNFADKIMLFWPSCVRVFQFPPVHGEAKLLYRFKFEMNSILNDNIIISDDDYESGVRYILVDCSYFVGYRENVSDINLAILHLWSLAKGEKIGVITAYDQSFLDLIYKETGSDVTKDFAGGLLLFGSDSDRFLVSLIDDRHKICQIRAYSIQKMKFINVVAELKSRTVWCFMKGDIVCMYHENGQGYSHISIYNVNGSMLTTLEFPKLYNPAFSDELCFSKAKVFLKVGDKLNVVSIIDSTGVRKNTVHIKEEKYIMQYFEPRTLLLFDKIKQVSSTSLTLLDIYTGQELWSISNLIPLRSFHIMIKGLVSPYKFVVQFEGSNQLSILNFGKNSLNHKEIKETTTKLIFNNKMLKP